jgi:hypothetical protein
MVYRFFLEVDGLPDGVEELDRVHLPCTNTSSRIPLPCKVKMKEVG